MSVTSVIIELPECEECGSRMKFFDQVWIEDEYMLVASILCVNPQCVNSSVVHIQAAEQERAADVVSPAEEKEYLAEMNKVANELLG